MINASIDPTIPHPQSQRKREKERELIIHHSYPSFTPCKEIKGLPNYGFLLIDSGFLPLEFRIYANSLFCRTPDCKIPFYMATFCSNRSF